MLIPVKTMTCFCSCKTGIHDIPVNNHRRQWIENRIRILSSLFAIDICSFAVMSNHIHLVLQLMPQEAESWTGDEVLERWTNLFTGPPAVQQWRTNNLLNPAEHESLSRLTELYRDRLGDLGWFMKCLNEPIARQANKEDGCTGHFWESRYKSQALLSEEALLSCMAYVDLNPIRAGMCNTPEESDHTSIKERIAPSFDLKKATDDEIKRQRLQRFDLPLKPLALFEGNVTSQAQVGILFSLKDYLQLVDVTGRMIRDDKRSAIPINLPPILERLSIDRQQWLQ
ncbi:MAG: REP element-mobilizing transposase RayT, partial [Gammaproteobacteria bacterium]